MVETEPTAFGVLLRASRRYYVRKWGSTGSSAVFDSRLEWDSKPVSSAFVAEKDAYDVCAEMNLGSALCSLRLIDASVADGIDRVLASAPAYARE